MKRVLLALAALAALAAPVTAEVVRPAPLIQWIDSTGKAQSTASFKGQPIVIVIAPSPRSWAFRAQVGQLQKMYQRFAAEKIICVAAFTQEPGLIRSNIPFAVASDGPRAGYDFQAGPKITVAVIGRDGNLDYSGDRVVPAQRIFDIVRNSYDVQQSMRR